MVIDKDTFWRSLGRRSETVEIENLGQVRIREFSAKRKKRIADRFGGVDLRDLATEDQLDAIVEIVGPALIDDEGRPLIESDADLERLKRPDEGLGFEALQTLLSAVLELNDLVDDDEAANAEGAGDADPFDGVAPS